MRKPPCGSHGMARGRQSWRSITVASILSHTQIVRQEESEKPTTTIFHCEPFCCLQNPQLGNMDRNVGVKHSTCTSR